MHSYNTSSVPSTVYFYMCYFFQFKKIDEEYTVQNS